MKKRLLLTLAKITVSSSVLIPSNAAAQVYTPPTKPASNSGNSGGGDTTIYQQPKQSGGSPFGQEIPLLDPSAETITIGGKSFPIMDNRMVKARFEKYLNQPPEESEEAAKYHAVVQEILQTISPMRKISGKLEEGFRKLPRAAAYAGDAGLSSSLAQAIYTAVQAKSDVKGLERLNQSLEREKTEIIRDDYWEKQRTGDTTTSKEGSAPNNKKAKGVANEEKESGTTMKQLEWQRRMIEIEALKKKNIVATEKAIFLSKVNYQASMVQWTMQRRFQHVLMAARFYNEIWRDGKSALHIKKGSDVGKLFSDGMGISPTVTGLDSLANEAIRETEKAVEAFDFLLTKDEIHTASMRLMEAFAVGEFLAPIQTLELEKKRRVQLYIRDLYELHGSLEAKDLTRATELIASLKSQAKDFPASKAESPIAGMKMAANLNIEAAKAALIGKDNETAQQKITEATQIWPTNPKLEEFTQLMQGSSVVVQNRNDFDRLLSEKNYWEILNRQYEIAPSLNGDEERSAAFGEVIKNLTRIKIALDKADEFVKVGSPYAAYEQLATLREEFPDDPKLGRKIELLAPEVADFTKALNMADKLAEGRRPQTGSALSHYLKAQSLYPRSEIAQKGIDEMIERILPE